MPAAGEAETLKRGAPLSPSISASTEAPTIDNALSIDNPHLG